MPGPRTEPEPAESAGPAEPAELVIRQGELMRSKSIQLSDNKTALPGKQRRAHPRRGAWRRRRKGGGQPPLHAWSEEAMALAWHMFRNMAAGIGCMNY